MTLITPVDTIGAIIDELATLTFSYTLVVPDGAGDERAPTLAEISAIELTVYVESTQATITAYVYAGGTWAAGPELLNHVDIKNVGRGVYDEATGLLTVTLHAGDSPFLGSGAVGTTEWHVALVTTRYNSNVDQLHKRVRFQVENLGKVPREP